MTLTEEATESHIDRVLEAARHDCRDRRRTRMEDAIAAIIGFANDADEIAKGTLPVGIAYLLGDKARRLAAELEGFHARDLISMRKAQS